MSPWFQRQTEGSVLCPSCGNLVGINDEQCFTCGRKNPGLWGFGSLIRRFGRDFGFTDFIVSACVFLYVMSLAIDPWGIHMGGFLDLGGPSNFALIAMGASGWSPVYELGRFWTVLSAGWLHGSIMHIVFNVMWIRSLGPTTAETFGPARMFIIYTVSSVSGFVMSTMAFQYFAGFPVIGGAYLTSGASAAVFGLLGALIYYGRRSGHRMVHQQMIQWAVILGVFGFVFPNVDNLAHLGGFLGGYLTARVLDPLHPEKGNHMLIALVFLGLTVASFVVSVVTALWQTLSITL